MNVKVSRAPN